MSPLVESPDTIGDYGYAPLVVDWKGGPAVFPFPVFWNVLLVVLFDSLVPSFFSFGDPALLFAAYGCPTLVVVVMLVLPQLLLLLAIM